MTLKKCLISGETFEITTDQIEFLKTVAPKFGNKTFEFPLPEISPNERLKQRLAFRNLRNLYRRKCDLSGQNILSMYEPNNSTPVYYSPEYWSDKWDPLSYGRDFDFTRPFFDQFNDLYKVVPRLHSYVILSENCEYINGAANCKNCYLSFNMDYCEDCYYLNGGVHCRSTANSLGLTNCELCYDCTDCDGCYELLYSDLCSGCSSSYFLTSCRNCRNCIACTNLVNQEFCIFNEQKTKKEYLEIVESLRSHRAVEELREMAKIHSLNFPRKNYFGKSNEQFSGNAVSNIKNSYECFEGSELENCYNCYYVFRASNCMDYTVFGDNSEWIYQCLATGLNCTHDSFCIGCWGGSSHNLYCISINAVNNCFGCASLVRQEHCILNKKYSAEEYNELVPRIIEHMQKTGEWGKFFPPAISPFPYNETVAGDEYPLTKEDATSHGFKWKDKPQPQKTSKNELPDRIDQVEDNITSKIFACEESGIQYKIVPQELALYRKLGVPIPRVSHNVRYEKLLQRRTPRKLWDRNCERCNQAIRAVYAPDRKEHVICESCYQKEVSG